MEHLPRGVHDASQDLCSSDFGERALLAQLIATGRSSLQRCQLPPCTTSLGCRRQGGLTGGTSRASSEAALGNANATGRNGGRSRVGPSSSTRVRLLLQHRGWAPASTHRRPPRAPGGAGRPTPMERGGRKGGRVRPPLPLRRRRLLRRRRSSSSSSSSSITTTTTRMLRPSSASPRI